MVSSRGASEAIWHGVCFPEEMMTRIATILCPVEADLSPVSETAIHSAVEICKRFGSRLMLEHNIDPTPPPSLGVGWMWSQEREAQEEERVTHARAHFRSIFTTLPGSVAAEGRLTRGPIVPAVLQLAREAAADLIVMGSHGPTTAEHESLTEQIVVQSPCAVMTTRADALYLGDGGQIVVAIDFSAASEGALRYAFALAEKVPASLVLLHVESAFEEDSLIGGGPTAREAEAALRATIPRELVERTEIVFGHEEPASAVLGLAGSRDARAILLGLHPRGVFRKHLSARARQVLHESNCPVWFVPPTGSA
jgi:nucleotide-binding universal stress UspA family protein